MAPPRAPPLLIDDAIAEILLRLPPDEPEHLFRAALVCKPWLRILCDAAFLRRYRAFHGAPPLLGLLHRTMVIQGSPPDRFASTTSLPDFPHPGSDGRRTRPLDCRHGRVLVHMLEDRTMDLLVWDPVTGDRHGLLEPGVEWLIYSAAVFCAADGCDHLDCHGGPFRVVFVGTPECEDTITASVYSSETGAWSAPVSFDQSNEAFVKHMRDGNAVRPCYTPYLQPRRGAVIGNEIYFTIRHGNAIVKYDWRKNRLSMIDPPTAKAFYIALMVMEDNSLGFACIQNGSLRTWSRKVDSEGAAKWALGRVIKLDKTIPVANPRDGLYVVGSAEGAGVLFVSAGAPLFMIKLNSGQVKKVDEVVDEEGIDEAGVFFSVLPYMSFYTPDRGKLLALAKDSLISDGAAHAQQ